MGAVKCSYKDCSEAFDSVDEMESHKRWSPEHNWCHKCDVDCDDYDDFVQHKVEAMYPWLYESYQHLKTKAPKHICCEFCGMDFKTFGGRRIHREEQHRGAQQIDCPGCGCIFISASSMIQHLEQDLCRKIKSADFQRALEWKHLTKQIMDDPDAVIENLDAIAASSQDSISFANEDPYNGVALYDEPGDLIGLKVDLARLKLQADHPTKPAASNSCIDWDFDCENSTESVASVNIDGARNEETKARYSEGHETSFTASTDSVDDDNPKLQLLHRRFWDPESPDYNRYVFFHFGVEKYCCPLKGCGAAFDVPDAIDCHFKEDHMSSQHRCPNSWCFKVFGCVSSLIRHMESSTKCTIRYDESYKELLDTITGGLLTPQILPVPQVVDVNTMSSRTRAYGLIRVAYKAKLPQDGRVSGSTVI